MIAEVVPVRLVDETVSNALAIAEGNSAAQGAIPADVTHLMTFATAAPGGSSWVLTGVLLVTIAAAFLSVGISTGLFESIASGGSALLLPPTGSPSAAASPTASAPDGACSFGPRRRARRGSESLKRDR